MKKYFIKKLKHPLLILLLFLFNCGCTSLTINKSIEPVSGKGWDTNVREVKDIAYIESYGEYGKFGDGAIYICSNNTIIAYPIPTRYASFTAFGLLGIPFIPLFSNPEQKMHHYEILEKMDTWDGKLYVAVRFYKDVSLDSFRPTVHLKNRPGIYEVYNTKKSEYEGADVVVYLFDIDLKEVSRFTVKFASEDNDCQLPDLDYEISSIFVYKPIVIPKP